MVRNYFYKLLYFHFSFSINFILFEMWFWMCWCAYNAVRLFSLLFGYLFIFLSLSQHWNNFSIIIFYTSWSYLSYISNDEQGTTSDEKYSWKICHALSQTNKLIALYYMVEIWWRNQPEFFFLSSAKSSSWELDSHMLAHSDYRIFLPPEYATNRKRKNVMSCHFQRAYGNLINEACDLPSGICFLWRNAKWYYYHHRNLNFLCLYMLYHV